jgi:hypothetical protein
MYALFLSGIKKSERRNIVDLVDITIFLIVMSILLQLLSSSV